MTRLHASVKQDSEIRKRWLELLKDYDVFIEHRPRKANGVAEAKDQGMISAAESTKGRGLLEVALVRCLTEGFSRPKYMCLDRAMTATYLSY